KFFRFGDFNVRSQRFRRHGGGLDCAGKVFPDATKVLPSQPNNFGRGFFRAKTKAQIAQGDAAVAEIKPIKEFPTRATEASDAPERQGLQQTDQGTDQEVEQLFLHSAEADLANAILKVFG